MVAVLHGAVVGGGLELAAACHVRVAETFGLLRAAGRQPRHLCRRRRIGASAAADRCLAHDGHDAHRPDLRRRGQARALGLSHYLVDAGKGLDKGIELAARIAANAPLTNFAIMHALPRIAESDPASGYLMEALVAAIAQGDEEAQDAAEGLSRKARAQGLAQLKRSRRRGLDGADLTAVAAVLAEAAGCC